MKKAARIIIFLICIATFILPKTSPVFAREFYFEIIADEKRYIYFYPEIYYDKNGELQLLDKESIANRICLDLTVLPQNATIEFLPSSSDKFKIYAEKNGRIIDKSLLIKQIDLALLTGKTKITVKSSLIKANVTKESLLKQSQQRSNFSTFYGYSSAQRKHNIALCASIINGSVIYPNEEFSFNKTVGKRSEERGFLPAKVILNGAFATGVGGGVCQVSSTLYNAFLLAGLTPVESHNHTLCVEYVSPSFDAMVSDTGSDLRFKNPFDFPIFIECNANGERIDITIYGEKPKYEYKLISKVTETIQASTSEVYTNDKSLKNVSAKNGLKSEGYIYVYENGKLIEIKTLRKDTYKPLNGIVYIVNN